MGAWQCPTLAWRMPHYHRRYRVSLLSSAWDQVVPRRYCRQAKAVLLNNGADTQSRTGDLILTKDALYQLSHISTLTGKDRTVCAI